MIVVEWMNPSSFSRNKSVRHIVVIVAVEVEAIVEDRWKNPLSFVNHKAVSVSCVLLRSPFHISASFRFITSSP